jgi:hypothetical protein
MSNYLMLWAGNGGLTYGLRGQMSVGGGGGLETKRDENVGIRTGEQRP